MSVQAISWAMNAAVSDVAEKAVLFVLANYADEFGVCWPSQATLLSHCPISERKLRYTLKALEDGGHIRRFERRRSNGSRRSDAYLLVGFADRKPLSQSDDHPILQIPDVVHDQQDGTSNRHVVPVDNRHVVPGGPAPRATLDTSLYTSGTTTGACDAREPWLAACLDAVNDAAVDREALTEAHELVGIWRRDGFDLDADIIPVLAARTQAPRSPGKRIASWAYFSEPIRSARANRLRQEERSKIAENSNALPAGVAPDHEAQLRRLADWINSGAHVPTTVINNTKRDELLARGLVTRERLRQLQIY